MPLGDLTSLTTGGGIIFWIGILFLAFAAAAFYFGRGRGARPAGMLALFGVVIVVIGIAVAGLTPAATSTAPPPTPNETVNAQLATYPALQSGVTYNTASNVMTVDMMYDTGNSTFCTASAFTATHGCYATGHGGNGGGTWLLFGLNLIRTDAVNGTASFPVTLATIPTATSLGASAQLYSIVGFKVATSTTPGQWQTYFSTGTTANQNPTVNAPSVATGVQTDGVPVNAFSSKIVSLHVSFAGGNSTSAPETFASALTNYTAYPMTLTIGQSTPSTVTVDFILIGWTT